MTDIPWNIHLEIKQKYRYIFSRDWLNRRMPRKQAQAALTELFQSAKGEKTPAAIEKLVEEIDKLVSIVRFDQWQWSNKGTREVKQALRNALMKQQLHKDNELFDKAYNYIREYY